MEFDAVARPLPPGWVWLEEKWRVDMTGADVKVSWFFDENQGMVNVLSYICFMFYVLAEAVWRRAVCFGWLDEN